MNSIGKLADLGIAFALLPGLLTFLIVRLCTARERKIDVTEAILHGLAYTLSCHAIWTICKLPGSIIPTPEIVGLSLSAIVLGLVVSISANHRVVYGSLRKLGVTCEPEYASIWETAFRLSRYELGDYVVAELDDERRIYGAIQGVSPEQSGGHLVLQRCAWLPSTAKEAPIPISGWFLIPASRVKSIHFLSHKDHNSAEVP